MNQNLTDDERKDIDEIVSDLGTSADENNAKSEDEKPEIKQEVSDPEGEAPAEPLPLSKDDQLLKLVALQNERLSILNKKVDVLTRLVELILRANLEDVD